MSIVNFGDGIIHVQVSLSFAFEHLDFVIDAFNNALRDPMGKVIQQTTGAEHIGEFSQRVYSGGETSE